LRGLDHIIVVVVQIRRPGHVLDRIGGQPVLVAHPADSGGAHVEDHGTRLQLVNHLADASPGVLPARGTGAIEPQLVQFAVVCAQLAQLGQVELVVGIGILVLRGVAVPWREVEAEFHPVPPARIGDLAYYIAVTVLPGGRGHGVAGGRRGPQAEPVMVLGGQDHVFRSDVVGETDPFVGIEVIGVEDLWGEGAVAPLLTSEGVNPEVKEDAEAITLPGQLLGSGDKSACRWCCHDPSEPNIGSLPPPWRPKLNQSSISGSFAAQRSALWAALLSVIAGSSGSVIRHRFPVASAESAWGERST